MFNDDKMVAFIFKIIYKLDYVRVLAHLKNVNFSSLLVDFNDLHVFLSRSLDSHSLTIYQVCAL